MRYCIIFNKYSKEIVYLTEEDSFKYPGIKMNLESPQPQVRIIFRCWSGARVMLFCKTMAALYVWRWKKLTAS